MSLPMRLQVSTERGPRAKAFTNSGARSPVGMASTLETLEET